MSKTATVRARIEPDLKKRVESLFRKLGLSPSEAITLIYRQVEIRKGLPFDVVIPTETTRQTLCKDADDMYPQV